MQRQHISEHKAFIIDNASDFTASEIATAFNISPSQVRQIAERAHVKLKKEPGARGSAVIPPPMKEKIERAPAVYSNFDWKKAYGL